MPTGGRTTNTQSEMLTNMLRDISVAKTLPDADLQFLVELETQILMKLRQPLEAAVGQMGAVTAGMPPGQQPSMPPLMPEAPPMDAPVPPPGGVPGLRNQPPGPSPDELARLMQAGQ
jgi:hypothetical protein